MNLIKYDQGVCPQCMGDRLTIINDRGKAFKVTSLNEDILNENTFVKINCPECGNQFNIEWLNGKAYVMRSDESIKHFMEK